MSYGWGWRPYVSVASRRANAAREMQALRKKGRDIQPVLIQGRKIATSFWGLSWCEHLEKFSDFENRLPRGRTYVRNGSVCHLEIGKGRIVAKVSGSEIYDVKISVKLLGKPAWQRVRAACEGSVASMLDLLQGKLSDSVMRVVTDRDRGLFPQPAELEMHCSCPDWATMCKHVAAVMYGIGSRLDHRPELIFVLRGVDHNELITKASARSVLAGASKTRRCTLDEGQLAEVFGIDVAPQPAAAPANSPTKVPAGRGKKSAPPRVAAVRGRKRVLAAQID